MKIKATISALVLGLVLLAGVAFAGYFVPVTSTTAASGSSVVFDIDGPNRWNVQACVTGFSGTIEVWSGETATALSLKHTWTLTTTTGCGQHYSFDPTGVAQIKWTRTAGTLDSVTVRYFPEKS